jgi:hypothetical protein
MFKQFRIGLAGLLMFCSQVMFSSQAFAGSISGIWWNKNESGWGINFSQQSATVFASMFVYRANGQPVWYVSTMRNTSTAAAAFSGDLFETTGPFFGAGAFNPAGVVARRVGTMSFTATPPYNGTLSYNVDGVAVTKIIEPQPLSGTPLASTYSVTMAASPSNSCPILNNPNLASRVILGTNSVQFLNATGQVICSASGGYAQSGPQYTFVGNNPTCLSGTGSLVILDLKGEGIVGVSNVPVFLSGAAVIQNTAGSCASIYYMAGINLN